MWLTRFWLLHRITFCQILHQLLRLGLSSDVGCHRIRRRIRRRADPSSGDSRRMRRIDRTLLVEEEPRQDGHQGQVLISVTNPGARVPSPSRPIISGISTRKLIILTPSPKPVKSWTSQDIFHSNHVNSSNLGYLKVLNSVLKARDMQMLIPDSCDHSANGQRASRGKISEAFLQKK